jgi:hypothetical protein
MTSRHTTALSPTPKQSLSQPKRHPTRRPSARFSQTSATDNDITPITGQRSPSALYRRIRARARAIRHGKCRSVGSRRGAPRTSSVGDWVATRFVPFERQPDPAPVGDDPWWPKEGRALGRGGIVDIGYCDDAHRRCSPEPRGHDVPRADGPWRARSNLGSCAIARRSCSSVDPTAVSRTRNI